jgi:hypothetical protein
MTTGICRHRMCNNERDMYSRTGLCLKHERIRARDFKFRFAFSLFAFIEGVLLLIGIVEALIGIYSNFTTYFYIENNFILMIVGLMGFFIFYKRTALPNLQ